MATSVTTTTVREYWDDGKRVHILGVYAIAAGDYTTGGLAITLTALFIGQSRTADVVSINGVSGYHYEFDRANTKVIIRQQKDPAAGGGADIPLTQLAATATPAAVVADIIDFYAIVKKV